MPATTNGPILFELFENQIHGEKYTEILSLSFNYIDDFTKLGSFRPKGNIIVGNPEEISQTDFAKGKYYVYRVDGCLLLSKNEITISTIIGRKFLFHKKVCICSDHLFGFFDGSVVDDDTYFTDEYDDNDFSDGLAVHLSSIEDKEFEKDRVVGYVMDSQCGSVATVPLLVDENGTSALLVGGAIIEKIFGQ